MKLFKHTLLVLFIPFICFSTNIKKHEKSKKIHKTYTVKENATVFIKNKYGNINVTTWNKNTVEIDVHIVVKGDKLSNVEDKLDAISIDFKDAEHLIQATTKIAKTTSNWSWFSSNNLNFKINYTVKMPITNNAELHNKYGNIFLDELKGRAKIDCDYGKIDVDKLWNTTNFIQLDYCSNSEINYVTSADIDADYSKLAIQKSNNLNVNINYTTFKVGEVKKLSFDTDYGNVTVDKAEEVKGNSDYTSTSFGTITKSIAINTDYGGLKILNLAKGFENVTIDASYASIKIETPEYNNFNFTVNLSYASFKYPKNQTNLLKNIQKSNKKQFEGTFGKTKSTSYINVKSNFGNVSLKLND